MTLYIFIISLITQNKIKYQTITSVAYAYFFLDKMFEERVNIEFCIKLGKSSSEILEMQGTVYGKDAVKRSAVFEWHKMSKKACHDVKNGGLDLRKCGKGRQLVRSRRLSIRNIAEELNLERETIRKIFTED